MARKHFWMAVAVLATGLTAADRSASAATVTFNFESATATETNYTTPGALSTLAQTSGGETLTITRADSGKFDVENNAGSTYGLTLPPSWGNQFLDTFVGSTDPAASVIGNLAAPVSNVSIQFGDDDADDDLVTLTAYSGPNGTGTALATQTVDYAASKDVFGPSYDIGSASVSAAGIESFTFSSVGTPTNGSPVPEYNTLFYDNIAVTTAAVPEPTTLGVAGLAAAGLLARRRRAKVA